MNVVEIKGAKSFLKAISLDNKELSGFGCDFIFRGHANAEWEAVPSAFRSSSKLISESMLKPIGSRTNREQIEAEFFTLSTFINELNKNGFHVPSEEILNMDANIHGFVSFLTQIGRGELVWPPKIYHSTIAIAQHYGISTRFLDFSYDPYVALYFAVKGVLEGGKSDYIAVYAINIFNSKLTDYDFTVNHEKDGLYKKNHKNRIYQVVKAPSSFNHNLRNQKGLFLAFVEKSFYANDTFEPFSIEQYIENWDYGAKGLKFITKSCNAEELMRLLLNRFYSASTMFPSIEGCVNGMYERHVQLYK